MSVEGGCTTGSLVGAVLGTFFATLFLCTVVAIVVFVKYRSSMLGGSTQQKDRRKNEESSYTSPTFTSECTTYEQSSTLPIRERATDCSRPGYANGEGETPESQLNSLPRNPKFCSSAKAGKQYHVESDYATPRDSVQCAVFHRSLPEAPSMISMAASSPYIQEPETVDLFFNGQHPLGLGFTIHGNMSKGIFVETVSNQGPAAEALQIGDQVTRLTLFMDHVVFEDALKIFGCISIYPIQLRIKRSRRIPAADESGSASAAAGDGERIPSGRPSNFLRQSLDNISEWLPASSEHGTSRRHSRPRRTTADPGSFEGATSVGKTTTEQNSDGAIIDMEQTEVTSRSTSRNEIESEGPSGCSRPRLTTADLGSVEGDASVVATAEQSQDSVILEMVQTKVASQSSSRKAIESESLPEGSAIEQNAFSIVDREMETSGKSDVILKVVDGFKRSEPSRHPVVIDHSPSPEIPEHSAVAVNPLSEVMLYSGEEEHRKEQLLQEKTSKAGMAYYVSLHDHFGEFPT